MLKRIASKLRAMLQCSLDRYRRPSMYREEMTKKMVEGSLWELTMVAMEEYIIKEWPRVGMRDRTQLDLVGPMSRWNWVTTSRMLDIWDGFVEYATDTWFSVDIVWDHNNQGTWLMDPLTCFNSHSHSYNPF